ncbi:MAG: SUMF1/EgtB/PvdO family nonheme iron enzyme [Alphaproteobacteria bacterium]
MRWLAAVLLTVLMLVAAAPADAARKALVIGNAAYRTLPLANPVNDATDMAAALGKLGFAVTLATDATQRQMVGAVSGFRRGLSAGDEVVVFYAGHGMQVRGQNWLIPVDADPRDESEVEAFAVGLDWLLRNVGEAGARATLMLLDACRDNPFARSFRSGTRGLARVEAAAAGTLVSYAARPGTVAADGKGRNSPFTAAWLAALAEPGLTHHRILDRVYLAVDRATAGAQQTYMEGQLVGELVLNAAPVAAANPAPVVASAPVPARPPGVTVPGTRFRDCPECPEMIWIPPGEFTQGSPADEAGRFNSEGPQRHVRIGAPLAVGVYEVTFAEWDACVEGGGCDGYRPDDRGWGRGNRPVINVSWTDAKAYVAWLLRKTGQRYRLLSESEWEYAARAGTTTRYSCGDDEDCRRSVAWHDKNAGGQTRPVGGLGANAFGLHDMHGNVWEWVEDCWNGSYAGAPTDGSAWTVGDCGHRVVRGGSWGDNPRGLRAAVRVRLVTGVRTFDFGFRVAR